MDSRRIERKEPALGVIESIGWREGRAISRKSRSG
jgi:hypothetical protein